MDTRFIEELETARGDLQEAIGHISYSSYPHINKELIKKLNDAIDIIDNALEAEIEKP